LHPLQPFLLFALPPYACFYLCRPHMQTASYLWSLSPFSFFLPSFFVINKSFPYVYALPGILFNIVMQYQCQVALLHIPTFFINKKNKTVSINLQFSFLLYFLLKITGFLYGVSL